MRKLISIALILFLAFMFGSFFWMLIDIFNGRAMHMKTSPYFGIDVNNQSMNIMILMLFGSAMSTFCIGYILWLNRKPIN